MSKVLEALDILSTNAVESQRGIMNNIIVNDTEQALNVLRKALTPPTADEVRRQLREHYKYNINYEELSSEFRFEDNSLITKFGIFGYQVTVYLPPHLITLIGKFYEGLEE